MPTFDLNAIKFDEPEERGLRADEPEPTETTRGVVPIKQIKFDDTIKEPSFMRDVVGTTATIFAKAMVPYLKFVDPAERERFMELDQQHQVRDLLLQNLEAVTEIGFGIAGKVIGPPLKLFLKAKFPKTYSRLTKAIGKADAPEKPAKIDEAIPEKPVEPIPEKTPTVPEPTEEELARAAFFKTELPDKPPIPLPTTGVAPGVGVGEAVKELPKYAGSINLRRQQISDQAKQLELEIFETSGKKIKITHDELITEAESVLKQFEADPDLFNARIKDIQAGRTPTIPEELAHRILNAKNAENFQQASIDLRDGKITLDEFRKIEEGAVSQQIDITDPLAEEAGRRLSMYNIEVGKNRAMKAIGKLGKKLNQRQISDMAKIDWDDPMSVSRFARNLPDPKLRDYFYEYWYNSILSGVPTHVVNVASNTLWLATQVPHRALSGALDAVISSYTGAARTRYFSEIFPMLAGFKGGMKKATKSGWAMLRKGELQEFETKWAKEIGAALGSFERSNVKVVRDIGKFLTIPTKALRGMDVFFNSLAYDGQMGALALRAAKNKGLKGDALDAFTKSFIKNPSKVAHDEALDFAKYATFMDDPGKIGQAVLSIRSIGPQFGEPLRLVVPFVRTLGNLLKRGIEMTPLIGLGLARGQNPADVIAKQLLGGIVALSVYLKAASGEIELVGAAPDSSAEREAFYREGKKAWSIGIGPEGERTYIQYRRIEPFNTIIASVAIAMEATKAAKDDDTLEDIAWKLITDFRDNYIDSAYLQGVTQILDRYGARKGAISRVAASVLVPWSGFFRSITRASEVYEERRETGAGPVEALYKGEGAAKLREKPKKDEDIISGTLRIASNMIPFLPKEPARVDLWGEEIELEGGVFRQWLPYKWSKGKDDPVEKMLQAIDRYPAIPDQIVSIDKEKVRLDDDIYRSFIIEAGMGAKTELDERVQRETWQAWLANEAKHDDLVNKIDKIIRRYRNKARHLAIKEQKRRGYKPIQR